MLKHYKFKTSKLPHKIENCYVVFDWKRLQVEAWDVYDKDGNVIVLDEETSRQICDSVEDILYKEVLTKGVL